MNEKMAAGIIALLVILFGMLVLNSNNKTNQLFTICQSDVDYNGSVHVREVGNIGFCNIEVNQGSDVQYLWDGSSWTKKKIGREIYVNHTN